MMKLHSKTWLLSTVVAAVVLTVCAQNFALSAKPNTALAAEQTNAGDKRTITVNGTGELTIVPDVAYINLAIVTKADNAKDAQANNAQSFAQLETVLYDNYKLDKKDVKTSGFQVQPEYSYADKEPKIIGYSATQTIQVTYRAMDKIGVFLDDVSGAGVNQVNGIQFSTEKRQDYEIQALDSAMDNAEAKAQAIAKHAGKQLKGVLNVTQTGDGGVPIRYDNVGVMAMKSAASAAASTSISPGELKITTGVTVQYEFE
jgi:hypothetical protein